MGKKLRNTVPKKTINQNFQIFFENIWNKSASILGLIFHQVTLWGRP
jgi:hypothetical protein